MLYKMYESRFKELFKAKQIIQELELKHRKQVNDLAKDLQLLGFAERSRQITKLKREIDNKTRKLLESI